ncbi:Acb2/Tad1 domain-containing protein [Corynebacterium sp. A21]|uniref:Acb2/Tad1 domain-containing protein n=1 Tax=Corynebacterium sp. A21 TaxID=3457318 RepID=UPI003FD5978F
MIGNTEIENRFGFHKATIEGDNATLPKHRDVRIEFREFAEFLDNILPDGRAKSVAFTELENASMWAHKAIAETAPAVHEEKK